MAKIRELRVSYEVKETEGPDDLGTIQSAAEISKHAEFVRYAVDEEVWALIVDPEGNVVTRYHVSKGGRHESMIDPASLLFYQNRVVILFESHHWPLPAGR